MNCGRSFRTRIPLVIVYDDNLHDIVAPIAAQIGITGLIRIEWRQASDGARPCFTHAFPGSAIAIHAPIYGRARQDVRRASTSLMRPSPSMLRSAGVAAERGRRAYSGRYALYHSYAIAMGLYLTAYCRGTLTILPRYRPADVLSTIASDRITLFAGGPTLFVGLMGHETFPARTFHLRNCASPARRLCRSRRSGAGNKPPVAASAKAMARARPDLLSPTIQGTASRSQVRPVHCCR